MRRRRDFEGSSVSLRRRLPTSCLRLLALLGFCLWSIGHGTARVRAESLSLGSAKQVFIDGRFMESSRGVELVVNRPRVTGEMLLVPEHPWGIPSLIGIAFGYNDLFGEGKAD